MVRHDKKTAVIGAGLIGAQWAALLAARGHPVKLYDADPQACVQALHKAHGYLAFMSAHEVAMDIKLDDAKSNIASFSSIPEVVANVDFVLEAASERLEVKQAVFAEVDRHTSEDVIITSSSSALLMSDIQSVMEKPHRAVIAHPFNPAHLVPLVEIVPGAMTSGAITTAAKAFFDRLGKIAIIVNKEAPGYVGNRLQAAVWREATDLVLNGVVSVEDVDKALYAGPGIRYAFMGQHLIYHLGGGPGGIEHFVDHIGEQKKRLWENMAAWTELPRRTKEALSKGIDDEVGGESIADLEKRRDEILVKLLKVIYG